MLMPLPNGRVIEANDVSDVYVIDWDDVDNSWVVRLSFANGDVIEAYRCPGLLETDGSVDYRRMNELFGIIKRLLVDSMNLNRR